MKILRLLFCLFFITAMIHAASVTLAWDPNSEPDVAGYRLYYGTNGFGTIANCGNVTNYTVTDIVPGYKYSFYVTCYNTSGLESEPSNVVDYTAPTTNNLSPVLNFRLIRIN